MDQRKKRLDGLDGDWRGPDFLSQVREVCRLRTDQDRSTSGAEIIERSRGADGAEFEHLVVRYTRGPWTKELVVGVSDGPANTEAIARFRDAVCAHVTTEREPELVYRGPASAGTEHAAREHHIWLRSFAEYQHVWEHHSYLAAQTQRLHADPEYPLRRHVDKRWSELGEATARPTTAAAQIMALLDTDGPRFILVLGDFGTGKTFLLRALAERLAQEDSELVPVLVTMRELTKGRTLDQLLAQHMSGEDSYHRASFRYLLREGKVALLFDGFDELAQRTDYARVVDHPAELPWLQAAKLTVTGPELGLIEDISGLIGATPRAVKRFINVYLLLKSVGRSRGWPLPEQGQVAMLLAIATGLPDLASELLPSLATAQPQTLRTALADTAGGHAANAQLTRLNAWLSEHPTWLDADLSGTGRWVELILRFRFDRVNKERVRSDRGGTAG